MTTSLEPRAEGEPSARQRSRGLWWLGRRRAEPTRAAITVNRPPDEVYRFWRDLRNLPRFVPGLSAVEVIDDRRSRWFASAPGGLRVGWEVEIVDDRPGEVIAWRAPAGAKVAGSGTVRFTRAPGGRGTEVHLQLCAPAPAGAATATLAKLFGPVVERAEVAALHRFKQVMETGEVVRAFATTRRPLTFDAGHRPSAGAGGAR